MNVFIIAAMSADGFIGYDASHRSLDWRSKADAQFFIEKTKEAGVMVMGSTTFHTFKMKRTPPGRRLIVYSSKPESIVGEGVETTNEDPKLLIERLEREGAPGVAICGGATIDKLFLDNELVDELFLTVEPVLFGAGIPLFSGDVRARLNLIEFRQLSDDTILLHYAVRRGEAAA
ncbi:MAG: dihydrofolate reductase family protein [Candidatus Saccharimonadales bacterium]